ncbi:MAG: hypothetical protein AB1798_24145 [Spirochaetota bacterium]
MKNFTAGFLVLIVSAGISLGQEADTSNAATEIQQVQEAAPVSAQTTECLDKKWIIGFEATSLDLGDLPGTVFLQRKISPKFFVGAGFSCYYSYDNPDEDYRARDSMRYNFESKQWEITITPEIGYLALNTNEFTAGFSLKTNLRRRRAYSISERRYENNYYSYTTDINEYNYFNYGFYLPVFVEKQFKIKKYPVAIGIVNNMMTLNSGWSKQRNKYTHESYYSPIPVIYEYESTRQEPVVFTLYNPFQGYVRIYFKVYL